MKHLAGHKGSHILHAAVGLPSSTTIARRGDPPKIFPCATTPAAEEVKRNLDSVYPIHVPVERALESNQSVPASHPVTGFALLLDGIAVNPHVAWRKSTNSLEGPCREHSAGYDMKMTSLESASRLAEDMQGDKPKCHRGTEATVAALAPFRSSNYHAIAFFISVTCKTERAPDLATLLLMLITAWMAERAVVYGALWVVALDGASVFRAACFILLMSFTFVGELWDILSPLRGLNLNCGLWSIIACPDPKHLLKRLSFTLADDQSCRD